VRALCVALCVACGAPRAAPAPVAEPDEPEAEAAVVEQEVEAPAEEPIDDHSEYADRRARRTMRGRASYYSDRFTGRSTANGDRYDPRQLTAASRTLPFGTIVRVTRVDTGASVIVRVNDRGPFRDHRRILDLSRAAAERLDMIRAGVIDIRAEVLESPP
jgi:rare lipoprotein A